MSSQIFHQIYVETGEVKRVPRGETPTVSLTMEPDRRIIEFTLKPIRPYANLDRKTVDWEWRAVVEFTCPVPPEEGGERG